jgi:hypothetical protein
MSVKHDHEAALRAAGCGCQTDQPIRVATEFVWGARVCVVTCPVCYISVQINS